MEESMLKTSWKQRIIIATIAIILLASSIAIYVAVIIGGGASSSRGDAEINAVLEEYEAKQSQIASATSATYFSRFKGYLSQVKAYNASAANSDGLKSEDLVVGTGATITEETENYYAYYIGWCADETIFDSSLDDTTNPTALRAPLQASGTNMIEGWTKGMLGAKIGGVRVLTVPGSLAYGNSLEICGGYNSPLKFLVMTVSLSEDIQKLYAELDEIYMRYVETYYKYHSTTSLVSQDEEELA